MPSFLLLHYTYLSLNPFNGSLRALHLSETDSYPTHETPIFTPEGPSTINAEERGRWEKKNEKEERRRRMNEER